MFRRGLGTATEGLGLRLVCYTLPALVLAPAALAQEEQQQPSAGTHIRCLTWAQAAAMHCGSLQTASPACEACMAFKSM